MHVLYEHVISSDQQLLSPLHLARVLGQRALSLEVGWLIHSGVIVDDVLELLLPLVSTLLALLVFYDLSAPIVLAGVVAEGAGGL